MRSYYPEDEAVCGNYRKETLMNALGSEIDQLSVENILAYEESYGYHYYSLRARKTVSIHSK